MINTIGTWGYLASSIGYLILVLLFLAARNATFAGRLVLSATALTLVSQFSTHFQLSQAIPLHFVVYVEIAKLATWAMLMVATREGIQSVIGLWQNDRARKFIVNYLAVGMALLALAIFTAGGQSYLFLLLLVTNLWLVVLLEQLYRNANAKVKPALWPLIIALGAPGVFDFVMFAQASMLNQLDSDLWALRFSVVLLSGPFLLISTRRMEKWSVNVFISRQVVFYSSMLMISGIYLLLMALAGYVLNYYGGEWGSTLSIAFLVMGGIVLTVLLMTERIRREIKVFITKHFFANRFDYRVEWMKLIECLEESDNTDHYQTALAAISDTLKIERGLLIKRLGHGQFQVLSSRGIDWSEALAKDLTIADEYCQKSAWIIDLAEYQKVEKSYSELFLDTDLLAKNNIAIIVPILVNQQIYGYFALSSPEGLNRLLNWEDRDLLAAISTQLSHYITVHEASEQLSEAKQFDAFNQMSAFLVHDLKNVLAQLELINTNAKRHRNNPEFIDDVFATVDSAATRLDKTLQQLRNKQAVESKRTFVALTDLVTSVVARRNIESPQVEITTLEQAHLTIDDEKLSSVLNHLLQNAQEATSDDGWVKMSVVCQENAVQIEICDNGIGMSEAFMQQRLFKPFDTTKGNAGMGIGVFEAKQFIESIQGSLQVVSEQGKGSCFTITLPKV